MRPQRWGERFIARGGALVVVASRRGSGLRTSLSNARASSSDTSFPPSLGAHAVLAEVSLGYPALKGRFPRVTHPSATPGLLQAFDLHVLGMPPAFVLSQDQTLKLACMTGPASSLSGLTQTNHADPSTTKTPHQVR